MRSGIASQPAFTHYKLLEIERHGLALLRSHGMVGVLEDLDQHRRILLLWKGKEASFVHTVCPLHFPSRSRAARLVKR
jgi:hypothetical protein